MPFGPDNSAVTDAELRATPVPVQVAALAVSFSTTAPLANGATYTSVLVDLTAVGVSQVQTEVLADQDGTMTFTFYADTGGTDVIRTLTVPYSAADGYRQFGAPTFGASVRYAFSNDSGVNQTDFFFSTKVLSGAVSPQVLALNAFVSPAMLATVNRSVLTAQNPAGAYGNANRDEAGNLQVALSRPLTGFGELRSVSPQPIAQIDAVYGIMDNVEAFVDASPGTGSTTTSGGNFICQTGVGVGGYGVIRTRRAVRYRPGQGSIFRWTAIFDATNKVASSLQAAGPFNSTSGFFVGYNGTAFGVMHRTGGYHETQTLTLTAAATGAETATLTLNSVAYAIPVTNGTLEHNAFEIAAWLNANQTVWDAWQNDDTVVLFAAGVGSLAGTYTLANDGGGDTIAGTVARDVAGVANTETWYTPDATWEDQLDGSGPSGMTIDQEKGNVFELDLQYLGYGDVEFKVENPNTGRFFTFYRFAFANALTTPTLTNPTLKVGWVAASLGSTTNLTVKGASALGGVEGVLHPMRRPRSFDSQRASVGGTLTSVFAIRVRSVFRGLAQLSEVLPRIAFVSPAGTKPCIVKLLLNPTFDAGASEPDWQYADENDSIVETDIAGTTFTATGTELAAFTVGGGTSQSLNFVDLAEEGINPVHLERGDVLCIAASISGGAGSDVAASLTWLED